MGLKLNRPDDWHFHLRDEALMRALQPDTARLFARVIIMPNLRPPVTITAQAQDYRKANKVTVTSRAISRGKGGNSVECNEMCKDLVKTGAHIKNESLHFVCFFNLVHPSGVGACCIIC